MNPASLYSLSVNPLWTWSTFAWKAGEMMMASAQVIGQRTSLMGSAGGSPRAADRREFAMMGQEKIAAAAESLQAVSVNWIRLNRELGAITFKQMVTATTAFISLSSSRSPAQTAARQTRFVRDTVTHSAVATSQLSKSAARVAHGGLKPIHSRATANARRLAKHR